MSIVEREKEMISRVEIDKMRDGKEDEDEKEDDRRR